ncbi:GumC family protein [Candidatus Magnetomonas plexicatena]|uniref:GumC family protein n=1 Tax=Candidatus Magnetomonas plexicatena TaxID=2552947 RepID=UPI0011022250|nr:polysaccharide biosynthesis tyrosine autokinase [Nitrospirales bacterium LBB_01]
MDIRYIIELLFRRRRLILKVFLAILLPITVGTFFIAPTYESTAKIMLKKPASINFLNSAIGVTSNESSSFSTTDRADYLALLTLRPTAEQVVDKLALRKLRIRQRVARSMPFLKPLLKALGVDVNAEGKRLTAEQLLNSGIMTKIFPSPNVKMSQVEDTDLFKISAKAQDPETAANIANTMAAALVDQEIRRVYDTYRYAGKFIDEKIDNVRDATLANLKKIRDFQEKDDALALDTQISNIMTDLNTYKKTFEANNVNIAKTKVLIAKLERQLRNVPSFAKDGSSMGNSDMLSYYKQKLATLYQTLAESRTKYTEKHPIVIDYENQINMVKGLLQREYEKVFDSKSYNMDDLYMTARKSLITYYLELDGIYAQNKVYPEIIKKYEQKLASIPEKQLISSVLSQESTATNTVYSNLLTYKYRVGLVESIEISNFNIVEPAIVHDKASHKSPSLLINMIIALFLGTILSFISIIIMEILDNTVKGIRDIKGLKDVALLGVVKKLTDDSFGLRAKTHVRSFKTISNSLAMFHRDKPIKTILVTSAHDGEGKSFLSSNLAISLASEGKKVLMINTDTKENSLSTIFGLSNTPGLPEFLAGAETVITSVKPTSVSGLFLIPAGINDGGGIRNLTSDRFVSLVDNMEKDYDFIIIDTPSLLSSDEAILIGSRTGKNLVVVVENERTHIDVLAGIFSNLKASGILHSGIVLNKVEAIRFGSEYYDTLRYFPKAEMKD